VSGVAADVIVGHERADDDADESKADKRNGESDIFDRLLGGVALRERSFHHCVLIRNREGVIHVHFSPPLSFFLSVFFDVQIWLRFFKIVGRNKSFECLLNFTLLSVRVPPLSTLVNDLLMVTQMFISHT